MMDALNPDYSRRRFIRGVASGIGAIAITPSFAGIGDMEQSLTILHTNDVHSHLDPFPANHPKYAGMGGAEARAKLISALKADDPELLLLDAGDMFQGTPYYNYFKGVPELKIMNLLGYDAGTLGNHEFDNGTSGLASVIPIAKFPILNCNYGLEGTELKGLIKPYQIFKRKGLRIGVFGLGINLQGLVDRKLSGNVVYYKAEVAAQETSKMLKVEKKCDLVICLSHIGFQYSGNQISDLRLARMSEHIDIIIGGHTHTFLDEPVIELNSRGKKVLVSQAGWAGLRLGKISVKFAKESKEKMELTGTVMEFKKTSAK
ncbi:MAG: bifunctional metallophosphatase/5'-nucleotidase [Bacteroidota bacterium]